MPGKPTGWLDTCEAVFQRPDPDNLPPRLVPVAAQIARTRMEQPDARALATLHARALQYLESIPKPAFL